MSGDDVAIDIEGLPGADLVREGIADLDRGADTPAAALVRMASARLKRVGIHVPESSGRPPATHRLYELLGQESPRDAYARYNALIARMASFADAVDARAAGR